MSAYKRHIKSGLSLQDYSIGEANLSRTNGDCVCSKMGEPGFGTNYVRYFTSGIVKLCQIERHPELNNSHLFPEFKKAQKKLEQQFTIEPCKPWLNENRLKVEVSQSQWQGSEIIGRQKLGEVDFPILRFSENSPLYITEGVELLEVGRSSKAKDLVERFRLLEPKDRWWVVDFFRDGKDLLAAIHGAGVEEPQS
jgi:hypothetical protein